MQTSHTLTLETNFQCCVFSFSLFNFAVSFNHAKYINFNTNFKSSVISVLFFFFFFFFNLQNCCVSQFMGIKGILACHKNIFVVVGRPGKYLLFCCIIGIMRFFIKFCYVKTLFLKCRSWFTPNL